MVLRGHSSVWAACVSIRITTETTDIKLTRLKQERGAARLLRNSLVLTQIEGLRHFLRVIIIVRYVCRHFHQFTVQLKRNPTSTVEVIYPFNVRSALRCAYFHCHILIAKDTSLIHRHTNSVSGHRLCFYISQTSSASSRSGFLKRYFTEEFVFIKIHEQSAANAGRPGASVTALFLLLFWKAANVAANTWMTRGDVTANWWMSP